VGGSSLPLSAKWVSPRRSRTRPITIFRVRARASPAHFTGLTYQSRVAKEYPGIHLAWWPSRDRIARWRTRLENTTMRLPKALPRAPISQPDSRARCSLLVFTLLASDFGGHGPATVTGFAAGTPTTAEAEPLRFWSAQKRVLADVSARVPTIRRLLLRPDGRRRRIWHDPCVAIDVWRRGARVPASDSRREGRMASENGPKLDCRR